MFKRFILCLCFLVYANTLPAFCDSAPITESEANEVEKFFDSYVDSANNYKDDLVSHYTDDAKIVRVVIKPDGTKQPVTIPMPRYINELKKGKITAKLVKYKNTYTNKKYEKMSDSEFKINAKRFPFKDKTGLKAEFIVIKTPNGFKIKEEKMETNVQRFLSEK